MSLDARLPIRAHITLFHEMAQLSAVKVTHSLFVFYVVIIGTLLVVVLARLLARVSFEIRQIQMLHWLTGAMGGHRLVWE